MLVYCDQMLKTAVLSKKRQKILQIQKYNLISREVGFVLHLSSSYRPTGIHLVICWLMNNYAQLCGW